MDSSQQSNSSTFDIDYIKRKEMEKFMTEEERIEAARMAAIAEKAERRAQQKRTTSTLVPSSIVPPKPKQIESASSKPNTSNTDSAIPKIVFKTKAQREKEKQELLNKSSKDSSKGSSKESSRHSTRTSSRSTYEYNDIPSKTNIVKENNNTQIESNDTPEKNIMQEIIRKQYFGEEEIKKLRKPSETFRRKPMFWDDSEDTSETLDPLYSNIPKPTLAFGKGYIGGVDMKKQRQECDYIDKLVQLRKQSGLTINNLERLKESVLKKQDDLDQTHSAASSQAKGMNWEEKKLEDMTKRDWNVFRTQKEIKIQGSRDIPPIRYWSDGMFSDYIKKALEDMKFASPTSIQSQTIPIGLAHRDLIGIAQTGYILDVPLDLRIRTKTDGPLAIIMAPTRELAKQINNDLKNLSKYCFTEGIEKQRDPYIKSLCIIGGESIIEQSSYMQMGIDIIVSTPGRISEALQKRYIVLNQCNYIVLDEADRMIDMGFEKYVREVIDSMGSLLKADDEDQIDQQLATEQHKYQYRTTVMFSATMAKEVESLAKSYLRCPITVMIGDFSRSVNVNIQQIVRFIKEEQKMKNITKWIQTEKPPIIIFANNKGQVDFIYKQIRQSGRSVVSLHSGKSQDEREDALESFKRGEFDILVATDVAARGLDIKGVSLVINYDMPTEIERYIHRIGRTGRAGLDGKAVTFVTENDDKMYVELTRYLLKTKQRVPRELENNQNVRDQLGAELGMNNQDIASRPEEYELIGFEGIFRHGTRHLGSAKKGKKYHDFFKKIYKRGIWLDPKIFEYLDAFETEESLEAGNICQVGRDEANAISKRFIKRWESSLENRSIYTEYTYKDRTKQTHNIFIDNLSNVKNVSISTEEVPKCDEAIAYSDKQHYSLLRFYDTCNAYNDYQRRMKRTSIVYDYIYNEKKNYIQNPVVLPYVSYPRMESYIYEKVERESRERQTTWSSDIHIDIERKKEEYLWKIIDNLYKVCQIESSCYHIYNHTCSYLQVEIPVKYKQYITTKHNSFPLIYVISRFHDVKQYFKKGPSNGYNIKMSCNLVNTLVANTLSYVIQHAESHEQPQSEIHHYISLYNLYEFPIDIHGNIPLLNHTIHLQFSHAETLFSLYSLLNITDTHPPTLINPSSYPVNYYFAMSSNIQLEILYCASCDTNSHYSIRILINEVPWFIPYKECINQEICSVNTFLHYYSYIYKSNNIQNCNDDYYYMLCRGLTCPSHDSNNVE
ncbi:hypothetical protein WA158_004200 [Blastocystis sp. Blastoise]